MMVKTRSASVALNDFPRIESNFVYTNLDRKNLLLMGSINVQDLFLSKYATHSGREASSEK
jgi:hypothetical protein